MAKIIAKKSKLFSDGEFVKECIVRVADVFCPEKKETLAEISLSRQTMLLLFLLLVYPSSSLGWRYGVNSNPGSRRQPN